MAPRWRPRPPPPKRPKGKNVIPFPSDRVKPPGGTRLGDIVPDPPINLEQIRKAKELELRNAIQSEGMSPFPEGKGLSGLGEEPPKKFKGVHEAIKDLSESMKKFNERHAPLLEREGLSGSKKNISSLEDQQLFILNRERMTSEQRAMRERDDKVMLNDLATLDRKLLNKREKEIRSDLDKLMSEDPRSDKKNSQGLPLTRTRIAVDRHYLDMIVAEIKRREEKGLSGLEEKVPVKTDIEKYDEAVEKQQRSRKEIDGRPYKNISLAELKVKAERIKEGFKEIERHGKDYFKNPTQAKKRKGESLQDYLVRLSKLVLKHKELPSQKGLRPLTPSLIKASLKNSNEMGRSLKLIEDEIKRREGGLSELGELIPGEAHTRKLTESEELREDIKEKGKIEGEKIRSPRKKKMSNTEKYMLESILKDIPEVPSEKGIRSLVDEKRLQRKLDKVGLDIWLQDGMPKHEGDLTDKQKYDIALKQQKPKDLSHLDHSMITDYEFRINKLIEDMNVNKPIEELVYDLGTMLDYVDWDTDYKRSGRYEGPDKRRRDRYYPPHYPAVIDQKRKVSGDDAKLQKDIYNLVYKIKAEIEKRMRDE